MKDGGARWTYGEKRAAMCSGKIAYASAIEAGKIKDRLRKKRGGQALSEQNVYRCYFCGHWHLGRRQKTAKKR